MKPMKYSNPSVRDRGGGHWQARFRYKEGDKWRTLSRNLEATSKRDANKKATQLHRQLEEEAERAKLRVLLVMDEDEAVLERFLEKYISGIEGSGQIERTTAAGYRSSAAHICRYLGDVRIDDITADMIVTMQRRLLTEDGLCSDSVAKDHRLLKQALSYAVETGREPNALDDSERQRLLAALDSMVDSELTLAVRLGLSAGLRREEICGLRWRDIDFQRDLILVRNAVTEAAGHSFEKGPKSETTRPRPRAATSSRPPRAGGTCPAAWGRSSRPSPGLSTWWAPPARGSPCTTSGTPTLPSSSPAGSTSRRSRRSWATPTRR